MLLPQLVELIKRDGCHVRLYDRNELRVAQCAGTFDVTKAGNPLICLAVHGHTHSELRKILLHEYAHFLQWQSGFLHTLEGEDLKGGWDILDLWLRRKKRYTDKQLYRARNAICIIEYDAELRTIELAKEFKIDIGDPNVYIKEAYSYVSAIKWSFLHREWISHPPGEEFEVGFLTPEDILRPLTQEEIEKINLYR